MAILMVTLLVALGAIGAVRATRQGAPPGVAAATSAGVVEVSRGLYAGAVARTDGRIDVPATIALVREAGADRYYYLVWDRTYRNTTGVRSNSLAGSEWEQLPQFAEAAGTAGISVVVYLVPPTESGKASYLPFGWDYAAWATAVGRLAKAHRSIQGMAIDDFAGNTTIRKAVPGKAYFSRDDVAMIRARLRAQAPWLKLYMLLYGQDFYGHTSVIGGYRDLFDGVIYAFAGEHQILHTPQNTTSSGGVVSTTGIVRRLTSCRGRPSCWQAWFPDAGKQPRTLDAAIAQFTVAGAPGAVEVSAWVADDRDGRHDDGYLVQAQVHGEAVTMTPGEAREGWTRYSAMVRRAADDGDLTLTVVRPLTTRMVTVAIADVTVAGGPPLTPQRPAARGRGTSTVVPPLELVLMVYASRFGLESSVAGAADAPYLAEVLAQARTLVRSDSVDGVVVYRLNATGARPVPAAGDPANLGLVRSFFAEVGARR